MAKDYFQGLLIPNINKGLLGGGGGGGFKKFFVKV